MSLDMLDASFMARRGVLRAQRTPYDAQFAVVLLLPRSDRPTQSPAGPNGERVAPAAPKNSLSWAHCIPSTTPATNPGSTGANKRPTRERGNAGVREIQINL